jgi:phage shock protein A
VQLSLSADIRRDLTNEVESLKGQLQQADQQIASYTAREKHFEEIMAKQRDQLARYESQLATNALQAENHRMESVNLVHQNVQLEANLELERRASGLKDLELNRAFVLVRKYKKSESFSLRFKIRARDRQSLAVLCFVLY